MMTQRIPAVCVALVLLVSGVASACSGGLERFSNSCPDGQELREERYDSTSISARGCVGTDSENNYRREGRWEYFYPSGQKQAEGSYVDGFQGEEGTFSGFVIDGNGREGPWVLWYENGQKSGEGSYRDGKEEGLSTIWWENGQKQSEATYLNGTRTSVTEWDESGNQINAD
jgi:hypothetical protein